MSGVERVVDAVSELTIHAAAMAQAGDFSDEEARAFLELTEPMGDVLLRVKEWLALADEGEDAWRGFLESQPRARELKESGAAGGSSHGAQLARERRFRAHFDPNEYPSRCPGRASFRSSAHLSTGEGPGSGRQPMSGGSKLSSAIGLSRFHPR